MARALRLSSGRCARKEKGKSKHRGSALASPRAIIHVVSALLRLVFPYHVCVVLLVVPGKDITKAWVTAVMAPDAGRPTP